MTHELNTPIASIKITAEALKTFNHSPQVQSEYLDMISYQSDKLLDLTAHILNTGRLNKNSIDRWTDVNLNELVAVAINDLKPQVESAGAVINYKPSDKKPSIQGDILSLRNVMVNLIDNALKYATDRPAIAVEILVSSNHAAIRVRDNGIGIPSEYHSQVFERFFRVPQGNLHDVKGFGLGLSYVKAVIRQHHGEVVVRDNDPSGAVFTIRLPLK
jgi:signal transduction histidine kinase